MKLLALDFEGTHKNPRVGCPIQLGVAVVEDGNVLASAEWLIRPPTHYKSGKPTREVDAYALRVSGLTLEKVEEEGLCSVGACEALQTFVSENRATSLTVLAYNFTYDAECYGQMLYDGGAYDRYVGEYQAYPDILGAKWICAYRTAKLLLKNDLSRFSLDDVAGHFNLARAGDTHGALEDAILAARVYHNLTTAIKPEAATA